MSDETVHILMMGTITRTTVATTNIHFKLALISSNKKNDVECLNL